MHVRVCVRVCGCVVLFVPLCVCQIPPAYKERRGQTGLLSLNTHVCVSCRQVKKTTAVSGFGGRG